MIDPKAELAPPPSCRVAFKEWAGVCSALTSGRQTIILRKGGVAEDRGRFLPEHPWFWLYPTFVHQSEQGLRDDPAVRSAPSPPPAGTVEVRALVGVTGCAYIDSVEALAMLTDEHVWTEEVLLRRFAYRQPGLWLLAVRVFSRPTPWRIAERPEYAGCASWLTLDVDLSTAGLAPVPRGGGERRPPHLLDGPSCRPGAPGLFRGPRP